MLKFRIRPTSHEDVFIQRYEWLLGWALQLTGHQQEQAEDLVHDAFVQFVLSRPDINGIANLEGYLYTMLRNMHLSQMRRANRIRNREIALLDYDTGGIGLRTSGLHAQLQTRDELQRICNYACLRKGLSKAGSILILRFSDGYCPKEIAEIFRSQRRAVDDCLRI